MEQEKLESLLNELSRRTSEPVRPELAAEIKNRIPDNPAGHKSGFNTFRIIIDLRVGRLATAAAILVTLFLCIALYGSRDHAGTSFFQDTKDVLGYFFRADKNAQLAQFAKDRFFPEEGMEVVYYGNPDGSSDPNNLLMHWKLDDDKYRVVFSNFRAEIVTAPELIRLQAQMLKKMANK
jgi:hypothetical protein